ncbi:sugar ABC transporter permease [Thermus thermamylovorans]|uniref:Sugar ABC transporter permease n=1 Tax=Thermus thermamylovorans TaxID=2509362 RepID=A0A4Q9AZW1_9DEIN|nr:sugar ABC transporter permease [Thermus thermamylovorans]
MGRQETLPALLFILPALVLIGVFILWPALETLRLAFLGPQGFAGLANFREVLGSPDTFNPGRFPGSPPPWGSLVHNALWILIHLPLTVLLGLFLAVLFSRLKGWWVSLLRLAIFLGMVTPLVVGGVLIRFLFDQNAGLVPQVLGLLGLGAPWDRTWTAYPETALLALILGSVWLWTGFSMVLHAAGLSTIDPELYEAAEIDGATAWHQFWFITLPLLWPVTMVVIALTLLWELKIFDIVFVATQGGPGGASLVLALQMYLYAFRDLDFHRAAATATLLTLVSLPIGLWFARRSLGGGR